MLINIGMENNKNNNDGNKPISTIGLSPLSPLHVDVDVTTYSNQVFPIEDLSSHEIEFFTSNQCRPRPMISPGLQEIPSNDIEFLKTIGKGSFGVVYKAKWHGTGGGRIIAVKKVETDIELNAFHNEIRQLSRVTHENIVQMYGITSTRAAKCLIMEYADGGSLYQFLHCPPYSNYTISHALSWLLQCAKAIAYLHAIQPVPIIHRDLKPLNMLLTNRKRVLKICDFGTACDLRSVMTDNRGSTAWMAPEVIRGKQYNEKCDVHSWGMILWEVLTRRIPYEELGQPFRILWQIVNHVRPPPIQGCPTPINKLMQSCWIDDHSQRPTMQEAVDVIYPLCKLMNATEDSISFSSSSGDSYTESCVSLLNDCSSADHTSRGVSEFTNSTNTIDVPVAKDYGDHTPETPVNYENAFDDIHTSAGNLLLPLPQLAISPNVAASITVNAENLLPPWGSAKSDVHSNPSVLSTPNYCEENTSLLLAENGDSPFVLLDSATENKDSSPFIFPIPGSSSAVLPTRHPSSLNTNPTSDLFSSKQERVFTPLSITIPNVGPPECTDIELTTVHQSGVLYSNTRTPPATKNSSSSYMTSAHSPGCYSPSHHDCLPDHSPLFTPASFPPINGTSSNYLLPTVTYSSPKPLVVSPPILTTATLTTVATTLTLAPTVRVNPKDSHNSTMEPGSLVNLRQNLSANDPGAIYRRRSAEVPPQSNCYKGLNSGHRRSSSYESSELIGFEPLAIEVLKESSLEDKYYQNYSPSKCLTENVPSHCKDDGRLIGAVSSPRNPSQAPASSFSPGYNSPGQARGSVTSQTPTVFKRAPPQTLTFCSPGGSVTPNLSHLQSRGGGPAPVTASTTRGHAIPSPLNMRVGNAPPSGRATNAIPFRKGGVVSSSDRASDNEELGALWELLDEELKPSMPQPTNHHSQQIFDDHKSLAHQLLVVQEEIVFLDQEKNKLRQRLKEQDIEQKACKKRYSDKIFDLQSKNETLQLSHSRLGQQLEEIRIRSPGRHGGDLPNNPTMTSPSRVGHSPQLISPPPLQRVDPGSWSPHLQHQQQQQHLQQQQQQQQLHYPHQLHSPTHPHMNPPGPPYYSHTPHRKHN